MDENFTVEELKTPEPQMNPFHREILFALNRLNKHIYGGTVSPKVKATRRAAGKVAHESRRINRP